MRICTRELQWAAEEVIFLSGAFRVFPGRCTAPDLAHGGFTHGIVIRSVRRTKELLQCPLDPKQGSDPAPTHKSISRLPRGLALFFALTPFFARGIAATTTAG